MKRRGWFPIVLTALSLGLASACGGVECSPEGDGCEGPAVGETVRGASGSPVVVVGKMVCTPDSVVVHADGTREESGTCSNGSTSFRYWSKTSGAITLR